MVLAMVLALVCPTTLSAQDNEQTAWGYGFQVGVGGMLPTSSLGDDFKGCAVFVGGLQGEWHNLRLKADVTYGQPSFKNDNPYAVLDVQGRDAQLNGTASATLLGGAVQLGYTVLRAGKVSVTPCAGVFFNRVSWDLNDISWEKDDNGVEQPVISDVTDVHENSVSWMASVDVDIRLHSRFIDAPLGSGTARYNSSLRISPFIAHASYSNLSPAVKGNFIGVTVSYSGLVQMLGY